MDFTTAEHAATVLALEVMKERTAFEVENRLKGSFTEDLLSGNYSDERSMIRQLDARHIRASDACAGRPEEIIEAARVGAIVLGFRAAAPAALRGPGIDVIALHERDWR